MRSELVPGGLVGWNPLKPAADGSLNVGWPELPWGALVQALGQRAVLEVQAWALGALFVADTGWYTLDVRGTHKALLYNAARPRAPPRLVAADLYGGGSYGGGGFGVHLEAGVHVLALRLRMVVQKRISVRLAPAAAPWSIGPPPQVPDLVLAPPEQGGGGGGAQFCGGYVALPLRNSGSAGWLRHLRVTSDDGAVTAELQPTVGEAASGVSLAPGALRLLRLRLQLASNGNGNGKGKPPGCPFAFKLRLSAEGEGGQQLLLSVRLRAECRTPEQSVVCTFVDHDGAVSAAAALRPLNSSGCDPWYGCGVLLTHHGTGIPVRDSADAYKRKVAPSDEGFVFGVDRLWVVAPTRHGAHNWEQGGQRTALAAVDAMAAMLPPLMAPGVALDSHRLLFVGHSMGGHGAWVGAVQGAARAVGVASVAGWTRKETYGDSNYLFEQSASDISAASVEPALEAVLRASIAENSVERHLPLLRGVPFLARTGDRDQTVHAFWARRATRILADAGGGGDGLDGMGQPSNTSSEPSYSELPGKDHWWWDTATDSDGGALNDDQMRSFFAAAIGARPGRRTPLPRLPMRGEDDDGGGGGGFLLTVRNPGAFLGRGGWRVVQAATPARASSLHILSAGEGCAAYLRLTSVNVRRFEAPAALIFSSCHRCVELRCGSSCDDISRKYQLLDGAPLPAAACEAAAAAVAAARAAAVAVVAANAVSGKTVYSLISGEDQNEAELEAEAEVVMEATVAMCRLRGDGRWAAGEAACGAGSWAAAERGPETAGPMRQAFLAPFVIVVGGGGDDVGGGSDEIGATGDRSEMRATLAAVGALLANLFVMTSESSPPVLTDEEVVAQIEIGGEGGGDDNVGGAGGGGAGNWPAGNLLLVGGPRHNRLTARLAAYWRSVGHAARWEGEGEAEELRLELTTYC